MSEDELFYGSFEEKRDEKAIEKEAAQSQAEEQDRIEETKRLLENRKKEQQELGEELAYYKTLLKEKEALEQEAMPAKGWKTHTLLFIAMHPAWIVWGVLTAIGMIVICITDGYSPVLPAVWALYVLAVYFLQQGLANKLHTEKTSRKAALLVIRKQRANISSAISEINQQLDQTRRSW